MPASTPTYQIPYSLDADELVSYPADVSKPIADRLEVIFGNFPGDFNATGQIISAGGELIARNNDAYRTYIGYVAGGAGISFAGDTNLYRLGAGQLKTDGIFNGGTSIRANQGQTNQIELSSDGKIYFNIAADTNLYRIAANTLKTDGYFQLLLSAAVGPRQLDVGAADSGGAGFRIVRVTN